MRFVDTKFLLILSLLFSIGFTSCEEGATVDIPGPDIDFQFSYSDLGQQSTLKSSSADYKLVAQSDTIKGKDIETFLSSKGQDYTSVIESATISNAILTLSENADFAGVDSIQIRYQIAGSDEEFVLAQAAVNDSTGQTLSFSDIKVDKTQGFELLKSNIVAKIYAVYGDLTKVNCFQEGVTYRFTAKTALSVKLAGLTEGLMGNAN